MSKAKDKNFVPFVFDGEGYSNRDRLMFVSGYEFALIHLALEMGDPEGTVDKSMPRENEDRVRVLCARYGRTCEFYPIDETWARVVIPPAG